MWRKLLLIIWAVLTKRVIDCSATNTSEVVILRCLFNTTTYVCSYIDRGENNTLNVRGNATITLIEAQSSNTINSTTSQIASAVQTTSVIQTNTSTNVVNTLVQSAASINTNKPYITQTDNSTSVSDIQVNTVCAGYINVGSDTIKASSTTTSRPYVKDYSYRLYIMIPILVMLLMLLLCLLLFIPRETKRVYEVKEKAVSTEKLRPCIKKNNNKFKSKYFESIELHLPFSDEPRASPTQVKLEETSSEASLSEDFQSLSGRTDDSAYQVIEPWGKYDFRSMDTISQK